MRVGAVARIARSAVALLAASALASCSYFGNDRPKPKPLEPIAAPMTVQPVWRQGIGKVTFPLTVAVASGLLFVGDNDGNVSAVEAATGSTVWRANAGAKIAAGVGSDGTTAAVVTRDGNLVALAAGQVTWKKALGVRVATAPLVAGGRVFVLGVDRAVLAFDASDGARLWQLKRPGDPLTLSQSGVIAPFKNTLIVGQGPRMASIDPISSAVRWEVTIGAPRGANEVERLADLVGPPLRTGDTVCARSFQAGVGCVNAERGTVAWTKTIGGTDAVSGDASQVFGADASDRLTSWKIDNGDVVWTSESLMFRGLSAPAVITNSVVFGDQDGTLHFFSRAKGESQARVATDGSAVSVPPAVVGGLLIVVTRSGGLFAFRPA